MRMQTTKNRTKHRRRAEVPVRKPHRQTMDRNSDCDADRLGDRTINDDVRSLENEQGDTSLSCGTSTQQQADRSNNDATAAVGAPTQHRHRLMDHRPTTESLDDHSFYRVSDGDDIISIGSPQWPLRSDEPPINDKKNSEVMRSLKLMQRIGSIKKRLSQSSLSHYSATVVQRDGQLRSKSMPLVSQQLVGMIDEEPASWTSSTRAAFDDTTPFGRTSVSFQSFSTMNSDVDAEQAVSKTDQQIDDSELVNVSRASQKTSVTPVLEHRVGHIPSPVEGPAAAATDVEQLDYVVDEQRANVVEKLRGAAFKRRMDVSRSRDSLFAKEQLHREQNLLPKVVPPTSTSSKDDPDGRVQDDIKTKRGAMNSNVKPINHQFRALPLPKTTGLLEGSYGLAGVPNIKKKETTKASSPCLGRRRQQRSVTSHQTEIKPRLLSPTYNGGGSIGIPRIIKKSATVPSSPMLGLRRVQSAKPATSRRAALPLFQRKSLESNSSGSNGSLLGLALWNKENPTLPLVKTPTNEKKTILPFVPHSTKRAAQRNVYDTIRRAAYEQKRREQQQRDRKALIKTLERDIEKIRKKL